MKQTSDKERSARVEAIGYNLAQEKKTCHVIRIRQAINKRYSFLKGQALQGIFDRMDFGKQERNCIPSGELG